MKSYTYHTITETAHAFIRHLIQAMEEEPDRIFYLAFSGGSTLSLLYDIWAHEYKEKTPWERIRIYWADECCVPSKNSESNYGTLCRLLCNEVNIPPENIYPIPVALHAADAAEVYAALVHHTLPASAGRIPVFDFVFLGAGSDGQVASIFPGQEHLLVSRRFYESSTNPYDGQEHVSITGPLLLAARRLCFLITGRDKATVVRSILGSGDLNPAAYVAHHAADVRLFLDDAACR